MPVKCIADKPLKDAEGNPFVGFKVFGGKHADCFIQGEVYPDGDGYLLRKYVHDFEAVTDEPPRKKPKAKPADSSIPAPQKGEDD